ncbi:hypothetical protein BYT27DRAFT_7187900 [Phlegmacium glaucopus]|nr:hypothetical protein BYT27DRAFT_7187900 [Phlegmacium glaucopus]
MPRRRTAKGRESGSKSQSKSFHKSDGKLKKWNTISDIPMDEEDQFHTSKDKILLDGDHNDDDDGDDDEVFALKGIDDDSEEDEEIYKDEDDEVPDDEVEIETKGPTTKKKSKRSKKAKGKTAESSEEEEEEEEEEGWGRGRAAYYSSNADQLESDDEEGNELEEQEAKRLQAAIRKEMTDDDFGLNDNPEVIRKDVMDDIVESTTSVLPSLPTDKKGLLRHLEKTSPESLALARDWDETARNLQRTRERISKIEAEDADALHLGMVHLHYQTLLSYSTMLAFYLHLRSSAKYAQRPSLLQSHPILQRLLTLKQSLATLEDLDFAGSDSNSEDDEDEYDGSMAMDDILADGEQVWRIDSTGRLEPNELAELLDDAKLSSAKKPEKSTREPPKKKRKTAQDRPQPVAPIFDLVEPQFVSSKSSSSHEPHANDADPYGEMTVLHSADLADKSARKKTLRFHTSKIDSASARRQGARNQAAGGDDDLPYRQRKKERDAQLVKEVAKKLNNQGGEDLNDEDPQPRVGEKRLRQDEADADESPDEYYELVKKKSKEKKEKKKAEYEEANGRVRIDLEEDGNEGPRSLTRAILKNKGLTPHRPKSVRNPRVKKRMRYEKAKKTVSSQKAIYKGGLSQSGGKYEGEKSGISKVVKSVRLG